MSTTTRCDLAPLWTTDLGQKLGQLRSVPVDLGQGERGLAVLYAADFDVDPYTEMFFYPTDTLKLAVLGADGALRWRVDLGRAVVPGMWFCPLLAWDLDGDGRDELFLVTNADERHPLAHTSYQLERRDAASGEITGHWPWPRTNRWGRLGESFRNFLLPGRLGSERRLITAQGTYGEMRLQAWSPDLEQLWETVIAADAPGARGSHMCPVFDLDGDGDDEILWGERCLRVRDGSEVFCADRAVYRGHSDIIAPFRHDGTWSIFTCRENDPKAAPRVVCFDHRGERRWGALEHGHIDMGWVARLGEDGSHRAMAIRIGSKTCGPDGRHHQGMDIFTFDAASGEAVELPLPVYRSIPVDLTGDGRHELVMGVPGGDGTVYHRDGTVLGQVGGTVSLAQRVLDLPGEQLLVFHEDGRVQLWADRAAVASPAAEERWAHPAYVNWSRLMSSGSNLNLLGGI